MGVITRRHGKHKTFYVVVKAFVYFHNFRIRNYKAESFGRSFGIRNPLRQTFSGAVKRLLKQITSRDSVLLKATNFLLRVITTKQITTDLRF